MKAQSARRCEAADVPPNVPIKPSALVLLAEDRRSSNAGQYGKINAALFGAANATGKTSAANARTPRRLTGISSIEAGVYS
jgi:hypothetical protein